MFKTNGGIIFDLDREPGRYEVVDVLPSFWEQQGQIVVNRRAKKRASDHGAQRTSANANQDDMHGALCEIAFGHLVGQEVNMDSLRGGDEGFDFRGASGRTVDVKGFEKPLNLFVRTDARKFADIFILAGLGIQHRKIIFIGWATKDEVLSADIKRSIRLRGVDNYAIPHAELRPMSALWTD